MVSYDALAAELAALRTHKRESNAEGTLLASHDRLTGALNFILVFYEPYQRHLDTEAWKSAEANGRAALAEAKRLTGWGLAASPAPQDRESPDV